MKKLAVLSLGSNMGDRDDYLLRAINALNHLPLSSVVRTSRTYVTKPFGVTDEQPDFLNMCVELSTGLSPSALLGACLGIEAALGRVRTGRFSQRTIDIDVLLYEDFSSSSEELTLPHPRMGERGFVLVPLSDLYPEKTVFGYDFTEFFESCDRSGVSQFFTD